MMEYKELVATTQKTTEEREASKLHELMFVRGRELARLKFWSCGLTRDTNRALA
jgi:hypothetical protein